MQLLSNFQLLLQVEDRLTTEFLHGARHQGRLAEGVRLLRFEARGGHLPVLWESICYVRASEFICGSVASAELYLSF